MRATAEGFARNAAYISASFSCIGGPHVGAVSRFAAIT